MDLRDKFGNLVTMFQANATGTGYNANQEKDKTRRGKRATNPVEHFRVHIDERRDIRVDSVIMTKEYLEGNRLCDVSETVESTKDIVFVVLSFPCIANRLIWEKVRLRRGQAE